MRVISPATSTDWSDGLKVRTRDAIEGAACSSRVMAGSIYGRLHLKYIASVFATIAEDDLARGLLRVVERDTGAEATFANIDDLIAAGWAID